MPDVTFARHGQYLLESLPLPRARSLADVCEVVSNTAVADPFTAVCDEERLRATFKQPIPLLHVSHAINSIIA